MAEPDKKYPDENPEKPQKKSDKGEHDKRRPDPEDYQEQSGMPPKEMPEPDENEKDQE